MEFRGEDGSLHIDDDGYKVYDLKRKVVQQEKSAHGDADHLANFLDAVRNGSTPNADIADGHKSTLLCHLGNIAVRTGRALEIDASNGHIVDNPAAEALWAREYRKGWMPGV
jgi:hypothetical protein